MLRLIDDYIFTGNISMAINECNNIKYNNLGFFLGNIKTEIDNNINNQYVFFPKIANIIEDQLNTDIIRVRMLCNWTSSEKLCNLWNKMSKGNYTWNNISIVWEEPYDYNVIINDTSEYTIPEKTIYFLMEPLTFNIEHSCKYIRYFKHDMFTHNNFEWHLSKTYRELQDFQIIKDNNLDTYISTVLSSKYKDPGHIKRVDFVKFLESKNLHIDVFGEDTYNYINYKGDLPPHCKDNGLFPYKYTFNVENNNIPGYTTEKLIDGILSECLVFYSGNYNIKQILDERSYVYLDLINFEEDYRRILQCIENDEWSKRINIIKEVKHKILNELQFFPRLEKIIEEINIKK